MTANNDKVRYSVGKHPNIFAKIQFKFSVEIGANRAVFKAILESNRGDVLPTARQSPITAPAGRAQPATILHEAAPMPRV